MNSGCHLSRARRFVLAPNRVVADGVLFTTGLVVVQSRLSPGVELYQRGISDLPEIVQGDIEWIDALRPQQE